MINREYARRLLELAHEQETLGANLFQIRALRVAAGAIERLEGSLEEMFDITGRRGLERIPGVGKNVAYTLEALITKGEAKTLERVDRGREPQTLISTLPGVGPRLAEKLKVDFKVTSLESLRVAAESGELAESGIERKRLYTLLAAVRRREEQAAQAPPEDEPSLEDLLAADRNFRVQQGSSWDRNGWRLKARFADTALAHRRGMTRDWVVVTFSKNGFVGQRTVVTEKVGDLVGQRVVRGREGESRRMSREKAGRDSAA